MIVCAILQTELQNSKSQPFFSTGFCVFLIRTFDGSVGTDSAQKSKICHQQKQYVSHRLSHVSPFIPASPKRWYLLFVAMFKIEVVI